MKFLTGFLFLRYGWFCYPEPKTFGKLSTSMSFSQSEGTRKSCSTNMKSTNGKGKQIEVKREELKENNVSEVTTAVVAEKIAPVDPVVYFLLTFYALFLVLGVFLKPKLWSFLYTIINISMTILFLYMWFCKWINT